MGYKIAIDGPAGAGKGFLASELSKKLNLLNIDTGAMYRAFALYCIRNSVDLENDYEIESAINGVSLEFKFENNMPRMYMNGEDVSSSIRTEEVGMMASKVSAIPRVRIDMVNRQRVFGETSNVVMEGRDIGSVVFPDAQVKIYLTALVEERAKRRLIDLREKGQEISIESLIEDIKKRDEADINKKISPLIKTEDAIEVDTTNMTREEVVEYVLDIIKGKGLNFNE